MCTSSPSTEAKQKGLRGTAASLCWQKCAAFPHAAIRKRFRWVNRQELWGFTGMSSNGFPKAEAWLQGPWVAGFLIKRLEPQPGTSMIILAIPYSAFRAKRTAT